MSEHVSGNRARRTEREMSVQVLRGCKDEDDSYNDKAQLDRNKTHLTGTWASEGKSLPSSALMLLGSLPITRTFSCVAGSRKPLTKYLVRRASSGSYSEDG